MKLWEINTAIADLVDMETGEVLDPEAIDRLALEREEKLRNIVFLALNAEADIAGLKVQIEKFAARKKAAEKTGCTVSRLAGHVLCAGLDGEGWKKAFGSPENKEMPYTERLLRQDRRNGTNRSAGEELKTLLKGKGGADDEV